MINVYLAGAMNGCTDEEMFRWRENAKDFLGDEVNCFDPTVGDYRNRTPEDARKDIVFPDLMDILRSDAILMKADRASWGTAMELAYSFMFGKPVYAFGGTEIPSPWVEAHINSWSDTLEHAIWSIKWDFGLHQNYN